MSIWTVVILAVVFGFLWKFGQLRRFSKYVTETREELRKCTWPTREELTGSTSVVFVASALIGAFTVASDSVIAFLVNLVM